MSVVVDLAKALDKACEDKSLTEMEISRRGVFSVWQASGPAALTACSSNSPSQSSQSATTKAATAKARCPCLTSRISR
jgi:hypothetical protein